MKTKLKTPPERILFTSTDSVAELVKNPTIEERLKTPAKNFLYRYTVASPRSGKLGTTIPFTLDNIEQQISRGVIGIPDLLV